MLLRAGHRSGSLLEACSGNPPASFTPGDSYVAFSPGGDAVVKTLDLKARGPKFDPQYRVCNSD